MKDNEVKAASFPTAFTTFLSSSQRTSPTQRSGVAIGRHPTLHPKALPQPVLQARSFPSQPCSPGSRSAPAAGTAPPFHCTWFRFTSPLSLLFSHPPIATHQFVPPENLPTARPSQPRSLFGATRRPLLPAAALSPHLSPRSSSSVTSVPPATLPLLFANAPTPAKKSRPVKRSGKRMPNTIPSGCRSQSCKPARASLALQPRQPQPPRSRRSAAVSLHMVPFHFGAAPAFLPCFRQRNRFPRLGLSHPFEECLHHPTHPFQRCEKQPQSPKPKRPMQAVASRFTGKPQPASGTRSRSSHSHITSHGCVYGCDYPCFLAQTWQRLAVFHSIVCPVNPQ
ncbi:MAG: hypothetical protein IPM82_14180 [Saprospiraceae bacterium]|nr:hypothetical protein [Saprospiraceae bacterium]